MTQAVTSVPDYGWTSDQAELSHEYLQPVVLDMLRTIGRGHSSGEPLRVFDAGCGNGALLRQLRAAGHEVAGCDTSMSGVQHARACCTDGVRIEQLSVCDDMSAVFGSDWDVVVATEVIEHLYAPRQFVTQARRLLRPGGTLLLTTPYHGYLKNLALAALGAFDRHFTALWDGGHIKFWSYRTLCELLREQRFESFEFRGAGRLPWLWKSMLVAARTPVHGATHS